MHKAVGWMLREVGKKEYGSRGKIFAEVLQQNAAHHAPVRD